LLMTGDAQVRNIKDRKPASSIAGLERSLQMTNIIM